MGLFGNRIKKKSIILFSTCFFLCSLHLAHTQILEKTSSDFSLDYKIYDKDSDIENLLENTPLALEAFNEYKTYKRKSKSLGVFAIIGLGVGSALVFSGTRERDPNPGPLVGGLLFALAGSISGTAGILYLTSASQKKSKVVKLYNQNAIGHISNPYSNLGLGISNYSLSLHLYF